MRSSEHNPARDQWAAAETRAIQIQTHLPGKLTSSGNSASNDFRAPSSAFLV